MPRKIVLALVVIAAVAVLRVTIGNSAAQQGYAQGAATYPATAPWMPGCTIRGPADHSCDPGRVTPATNDQSAVEATAPDAGQGADQAAAPDQTAALSAPPATATAATATCSTPPAPGSVLRFSGSGQDVTDPFTLPKGSYKLAVSMPNGSIGIVGTVNAVSNGDQLASFSSMTAPYHASALVVVDHDERVVLQVQDADADWTATFTPVK